VNVGKITNIQITYPAYALDKLVTTGFVADGAQIANFGAAIGSPANPTAAGIIIDGDSSLTNGANLTLSAGRAPGPAYQAAENNGTMTLVGSTANLGVLSGSGSIVASNESALAIQSASSGETIRLQASHLVIGGQGGFSSEVTQNGISLGAGPAGGMSFLAPIAMDNGTDSSITLANTQATSMVLKETGNSLHEVLLYNGSAEVADLKISGPSELYAEQMVGGPSGTYSYVNLTTQPTDHPLATTVQS
jgi:hypothetical protein